MPFKDKAQRFKRRRLLADDEPMSSRSNNDSGISWVEEDGAGPSSAVDSTAGTTVSQEPTDASSQPGGWDPADGAPTWNGLWAEAYKTLCGKPEYSRLLPEFVKYVQGAGDEAPNEATTETPYNVDDVTEGLKRLKLIQAAAEEKMNQFSEAQLSFTVGSKTVIVRKVVRKAIKAITAFKDVISEAAKTEPHAALAWAGFTVILPLIEQVFKEDDDANDGLIKIVFLLVRYQKLQEDILVPESSDPRLSESTRQLLSNVRAKLVDVYVQVYVYEIRFVHQYSRAKALRAVRNFWVAGEWKCLWAEIESLSQQIDQGIQTCVDSRICDTWQAIKEIMATQQATVELVKDENRIHRLQSLPCAENAIFDSGEVQRANRPCLRGTQRHVLNAIQDWVGDPQGEAIFWLYGMAGTGKTSIALTIATALRDRQPFAHGNRHPAHDAFLGASFFFKQDDSTRDNTKSFFTTLARRLAQEFPDLGDKIADAVSKNLEIGTKSPQQQLQKLIVDPLSTLDQLIRFSIRLVVVVDALDECRDGSEAEELICLLGDLKDFHRVELRVLITSRLDSHISRSFDKLPNTLHRRISLQKVPLPTGGGSRRDDITLYIGHALAQIAEKYGVRKDWIDLRSIIKLSIKADGLFIYAATICRYLDFEDFSVAEARDDCLDLILSGGTEGDAPQQRIDDIYLKVLSFPRRGQRTNRRFYDSIRKILGFIAVFFEPVTVVSLSKLLSLERKELDTNLRWLHSVVDVPRHDDSPISLVHLSFRDFLLCAERSKDLNFRVDEKSMHYAVSERCLTILQSYLLDQDICRLGWPGRLASEVPRSQIEASIPQHLRYACRYWVDHLAELDDEQRGAVGLTDDGRVYVFLREKLLFWLEAMSLIREMPAVVPIINRLETLFDAVSNPELFTFVRDTIRFLNQNRWIIEHTPLQIYCSSLLFCSTTSKIRSEFNNLIPHWIVNTPEVDEDLTPELSLLMGHISSVSSVAFSPSGNLIASGSNDGTTIVWDYVKNTEVYEFNDSTFVNDVAFSPDGSRIASGDEIVRVRECAKGRMITLTGPSDEVGRVAFSPKDSNILASTSWSDKRIIVWNIERRETRFLDAPEFYCPKIAFSPSGDFLAAGSGGSHTGIVRLWGLEKGELRTSFKGHDSNVNGVAISMDEKTVASTTSSQIKLWDVATGREQHAFSCLGVFNGVAFCPPKGDLLAVGINYSIELRRVDNFEVAKRFISNGRVNGISFSRDGRLVAAACEDSIVRLWDMAGETKRAGRQHHDQVSSLKFLPGVDDVVVSTTENTRFDMTSKFWYVDGRVADPAPETVHKVCTSPDEKFVILEEQEHSAVQFWDQSMARRIARYDGWCEAVFSPDSSRVALLSIDRIRIINTTTLEVVSSFDADRPWQFTFSPDNRVVSWSKAFGGEFCLLDLTTMEILANYPDPDRLIGFSPDGCLAAISHHPGNGIILLEVATGKERATWDTKKWSYGSQLAFHPNNSFIVQGGWPDIVGRDTTSGDKLFAFELRGEFWDVQGIFWDVKGLAVSTGGMVAAVIVIEEEKTNICLWDTSTSTEVGRYTTGLRIDGLSFSHDSQHLEIENARLPLPSPNPGQGVERYETLEPASEGLHVGKEWVLLGFKNLLWLPKAYREHLSLRFRYPYKEALLAMGDRYGRVSFIKFDLTKIPSPG